jgi:F0F1-type ATP synthase membrane subunit a
MDIIPSAPVKLFGLPLEGFNVATLLNSWLVMALLILTAYATCRRLHIVPGRLQSLFELITEFFLGICEDSLGKGRGRRYMPFIVTIFLFVFLSNIIGSIPNFLWWTRWPGFYAPTQDLNTPVALAFMVIAVVHISGIRVKGLNGWLWEFYEPSFPGGGMVGKIMGLVTLGGAGVLNYWFISAYLRALPTMEVGPAVAAGLLVGLFFVNCVIVTLHALKVGRVPNAAIAPLNFVGEIGKSISLPFRLFGNIFGGFVIVVVVSHLILYIGLPPFLNLFFGLFIGLVQAFVFAMLAMAYIAVQVTD